MAQFRIAECCDDQNSEYRQELRNEDIREYYLDLDRLATGAYPNDGSTREGSLRESFIADIHDAKKINEGQPYLEVFTLHSLASFKK